MILGVWNALPPGFSLKITQEPRVELFESADKLATLVGQHDKFAEAKKYSKRTHEKCYSARLALKQHQAEHGCRAGVANEL